MRNADCGLGVLGGERPQGEGQAAAQASSLERAATCYGDNQPV